MACGHPSGQCLSRANVPPIQPVCCDWDEGYLFSSPDLYNFEPVDTFNRHCCFVGIETDGTKECGPGIDFRTHAAEGRACGFGCKDCDDTGGGGDSSSSVLGDQRESLDGQRWLMPTTGPLRRPWDARGMIHDLRSNEFHPIPGRIVYERGTCWANDGEECFGADACACFGANTVDPWIYHDDGCGGVGVGNSLPGLLPDEFFRTGYRWPPNDPGVPTQEKEQWYCQQFGDTRRRIEEGGHNRSEVVVDPTSSDGMDGLTEGMLDPALLSSNACQSDRMADCTGVLAKGSTCDHFSAYGECIDHPEAGVDCDTKRYAAAGEDGLFGYLGIDRDPGEGNHPHIIAGEDDARGLGRTTAAWKNSVLAAIRTESFPLPREEGGAERTITFDRLDHMVDTLLSEGLSNLSNRGIGLFQREWIATPGTLVKVPNGSGTGRLRQAGCEFEYSTSITRVKIVCRLILQQRVDRDASPWVNSILPLVRFHIIARTTIGVSNLHSPTGRGVGAPCSFASSRWQGRPVYLDVQNVWVDDHYVPTLSSSLVEPRDRPDPDSPTDLLDYDESFQFFDADGRQFIPNPLVEWRGFLGGHSKPSADDWADAIGLSGNCETIADQFSTTVPGWPTHVDSPGGPEGDDPAGIYGGHVIIDFPGAGS